MKVMAEGDEEDIKLWKLIREIIPTNKCFTKSKDSKRECLRPLKTGLVKQFFLSHMLNLSIKESRGNAEVTNMRVGYGSGQALDNHHAQPGSSGDVLVVKEPIGNVEVTTDIARDGSSWLTKLKMDVLNQLCKTQLQYLYSVFTPPSLQNPSFNIYG